MGKISIAGRHALEEGIYSDSDDRLGNTRRGWFEEINEQRESNPTNRIAASFFLTNL